MLATFGRPVLLLTLLVLSAACNNNFRTATDWQNDRMDETKQRFGAHNMHMVDNAILHDMSVADFHFIPHTAELSGVGEVRLNRMATLLNTYGGTVRYETLLGNETLIKQRLGHVHEYLALTGCDMQRVEVSAMMSGGRGIPGDEAVAKFRKGTAQDKGKDSRSATLVPSLLSPSGQ